VADHPRSPNHRPATVGTEATYEAAYGALADREGRRVSGGGFELTAVARQRGVGRGLLGGRLAETELMAVRSALVLIGAMVVFIARL
jgi:hypothetical protein